MDQPSSARPHAGAAFAISLACAMGAAALGALASIQARSFYADVVRPAWAPPGWLFGPVWTALYLLMAVAAWRVWRAQPTTSSPDARSRRQALVLYTVQLALNALWTWLFFAWHQGALATAEIVALWLVIAATIRQFNRVDAPAAWMMAPYLAWVSFATALSWTIWRSNPGLL